VVGRAPTSIETPTREERQEVKRTLIVDPAAESDVDDAAEYIAADAPSAGERFLAAVDATFSGLVRMPELGRLREYAAARLARVRSLPVQRFENWLIFYRPLPDGIEILRVLHGARDVEAILEQAESEQADEPEENT
jgi:toxin ParE1/3/4